VLECLKRLPFNQWPEDLFSDKSVPQLDMPEEFFDAMYAYTSSKKRMISPTVQTDWPGLSRMPPKVQLSIQVPESLTKLKPVYDKSPHPSKYGQACSLSQSDDDPEVKDPAPTIEPPSYPLCTDLRGYLDSTGLWWLSCLSIFYHLEDRAGVPNKNDRCRKAGQGKQAFAHPLTKGWTPNRRWTGTAWIEEVSDKGAEWMVQAAHVQAFVLWSLSRRRIASKDDRSRLAAKFGIQADVTPVPVAVEQSMIDFLKAILPCHVQTQYRLGSYRMDAYIDRFRLAIQIDEHGHSGYNQDDERKMDDKLRDDRICLIRFNPHGRYDVEPKQMLARLVIERLLSPEFLSFRKENLLC
jgi:very-short-patch-repair endonuclease